VITVLTIQTESDKLYVGAKNADNLMESGWYLGKITIRSTVKHNMGGR